MKEIDAVHVNILRSAKVTLCFRGKCLRFLSLNVLVGALVALLISIGSAVAAEPVSYCRDGSASFPQAEVPYDFDGNSGKHIAWKTALPNWSSHGPIVDAGKIFLMSEPIAAEGYAPFLHCIDAETGKELWRREIDPVSCMPAEKQKETRRFVRETWALWSRQEQLWSEAWLLWRKHKREFKDWATPPASIAGRWSEIEKAVSADGFEFKEIKKGKGGPFPRAKGGEIAKRMHKLSSLSMGFAPWRSSGTWLGIAYPSPLSYQGHVCVLTQHNHFACYKHDGSLVWQRRFPRTSDKILSDAAKKRIPAGGWNPSWPGSGGFATSPIMVDGVLLSCAGQMMRALDAKTGKVHWELPYRWEIGQWHCDPSVARVDGEAVMIAAGSHGKNFKGDELIRIRDGQSVGLLPSLSSARSRNVTIVIDGDLVITLAVDKKPKTTIAYRLRWDDDRSAIVHTEVWRFINIKNFDPLNRKPWVNGILHSAAGVFDLRSGAMLRAPGYKNVPHGGYCGHGGFIVGPAFCKWEFYKGEFHFYDRKSGKSLGIGRLPVNPKDGKSTSHKLQEEFRARAWHWLGPGTPFAVGNRLYIRSYDFLWCIAP